MRHQLPPRLDEEKGHRCEVQAEQAEFLVAVVGVGADGAAQDTIAIHLDRLLDAPGFAPMGNRLVEGQEAVAALRPVGDAGAEVLVEPGMGSRRAAALFQLRVEVFPHQRVSVHGFSICDLRLPIFKGLRGAKVVSVVSFSRCPHLARLFLPIPAHFHRHPLGGLDEVEFSEALESGVPLPLPEANERLGEAGDGRGGAEGGEAVGRGRAVEESEQPEDGGFDVAAFAFKPPLVFTGSLPSRLVIPFLINSFPPPFLQNPRSS